MAKPLGLVRSAGHPASRGADPGVSGFGYFRRNESNPWARRDAHLSFYKAHGVRDGLGKR